LIFVAARWSSLSVVLRTPKVGDVNRKYMKLAAAAFVIWYVVSSPEGAARLVHSVMEGLGQVAESLSKFVSAIP
jgi:hypothetical protein